MGKEEFESEFSYSLVEKAIERLSVRSKLSLMAYEVLRGIQNVPTDSPYAVENDDWIVCGGPLKDNKEVIYVCGGNFVCPDPGGFECPAISQFNDCGKTVDFSCASDVFDCEPGGKKGAGIGKVFNCGTFECDVDANKAAFSCNVIDFMCGGEEFECEEGFQCVAGHVFMCTNDHDCNDKFLCSSTGDPKCNPSPPGAYSRPDGGVVDNGPGDFLCGMILPNPKSPNSEDQFSCTDVFECKPVVSGGEFDCWDTKTTFSCGTNDKGDSFSCIGKGDVAGPFECDNIKSFTCLPVTNFSCVDEKSFVAFSCTTEALAFAKEPEPYDP